MEAIIDSNIANRRKLKTPTIIDYSCGSGHFIIAALEAVHRILQGVGTPETAKLVANGYDWAGDSVYGVEKDYRLAKTTKISTFLNGDGQASIIHADGLDAFNSNRYSGLLSSTTPNTNGRFDIVLANPPYSIDGFIKSVAEVGGAETFGMFSVFCDALSKSASTGDEAKTLLDAAKTINPFLQIATADLEDNDALKVLAAYRDSELDKVEAFINTCNEQVLLVTAPTQNASSWVTSSVPPGVGPAFSCWRGRRSTTRKPEQTRLRSRTLFARSWRARI